MSESQTQSRIQNKTVHRTAGVDTIPRRLDTARLTVVDKVCFEPVGEQPIESVSAFDRKIDTETPFVPISLTVGEELVGLPEWLPKNLAMLTIKNLPTKWNCQPTDEQRAEAEAKVLRICGIFEGGSLQWLIPPGESMRGMPANWQRLRMRCDKGTTKVQIFAVPGPE